MSTRYTVTAHPAPGACTVPGHEGSDATVYTVEETAQPDADAATGLTVTATPWRTEYTYRQGSDFLTVTDPDALPAPLRGARAALDAHRAQEGTR